MAYENIESQAEEDIMAKVRLQQDRKRRLFEYKTMCELINSEPYCFVSEPLKHQQIDY